jgi:hypothetical protein
MVNSAGTGLILKMGTLGRTILHTVRADEASTEGASASALSKIGRETAQNYLSMVNLY